MRKFPLRLNSQPEKNAATFSIKPEGGSTELVSPQIKSENHATPVQGVHAFGVVDPSPGGEISFVNVLTLVLCSCLR